MIGQLGFLFEIQRPLSGRCLYVARYRYAVVYTTGED